MNLPRKLIPERKDSILTVKQGDEDDAIIVTIPKAHLVKGIHIKRLKNKPLTIRIQLFMEEGLKK